MRNLGFIAFMAGSSSGGELVTFDPTTGVGTLVPGNGLTTSAPVIC